MCNGGTSGGVDNFQNTRNCLYIINWADELMTTLVRIPLGRITLRSSTGDKDLNIHMNTMWLYLMNYMQSYIKLIQHKQIKARANYI